MKTLYPGLYRQFLANAFNTILLVAFLLSFTAASAQNISFTNYKLIGGAAGQKGATYRFSAVTQDLFGKPASDCIVKIESITPGVTLKQINQNTAGNISSFQPEVEYQDINGPSWIEFSFTFVSHNNSHYNNYFTLPVMTTSVSGLNNYGTAHEFAECNLGQDSKVVYDSEITNLMISATGNGYRAENKWGSENASKSQIKNTEKLSIVNKNISVIKIKIGINRNNNNWSGTSKYTIELRDAGPDMAKAYMPDIVGFQARMQQDQVELAWSSPNQDNLQDISIEKSLDGEIFREVGRFRKTDMEKDGLYLFTDEAKTSTTMGAAFYRLRTRDMEGNFQYSSVKMVALKKKDNFIKTDISINPETGTPVLLTPLGWQQKEIFVEIFNADGDLVKKISEKKAGAQMNLPMKDLAAGAYVVRFTCGNQYSTQYIIHSESL
ncbi:T9SS type A sorting domain-containing protein [Flavihumibacter fluvii]|uniref:T9SS type A sorting domain-containing protein n=1 Tax=Flavihumibacter fluvii TaxID=2838157 RepID=UPI001BDDCF8E|nr:T9SS type A sorting domain-containing protein [Flavihumibacter fluvii]ULQ50834.1 T9SS type A sorting domain-containing protein [Flavihumibacter fluvii]